MNNLLRNAAICLLLIAAPESSALALSHLQVVDLANPVAPGARVELEGRFLSRVNYETLLFEDETGRIEVLVSDDDMFPERLLTPGYRVIVRGELGSGYRQAPVLLFDTVKVVSHDPAREAEAVSSTDQGLPDQAPLNHDNSASPVVNVGAGHGRSLCVREGDAAAGVRDVLADRCFGQGISLVGSFVAQVNYETLLFRDPTGEIEVVFADDDMRLVGKDAWSGPVRLQGEVAHGYRDSVVIAFDRLKYRFAGQR